MEKGFDAESASESESRTFFGGSQVLSAGGDSSLELTVCTTVTRRIWGLGGWENLGTGGTGRRAPLTNTGGLGGIVGRRAAVGLENSRRV
jgi:hypothetical protein